MSRQLLSLVLACSLILSTYLLVLPAWGMGGEAAGPSQIAALPLAGRIFRGTAPALGIHQGKLLSCPASPNCVASQYSDPTHGIDPIYYQTDRTRAKKALLEVLKVVPRTTVVAATEDYIRAESTSRLLGFVDDVEFYLPEGEKAIHLRSASRLGESDLGVNRRRVEQIRLALQDLGV